jgi:hypothetical protein
MTLAIVSNLILTTSLVSATEPTVTTISANNITTNTSTLRGSLTDNGTASEPVSVYFKYGMVADDLDKTTPTQQMYATGNFSADISNLTPGTTYYFNAIAIGDGISTGSTMSFTTQFLLPPPFDGDQPKKNRHGRNLG